MKRKLAKHKNGEICNLSELKIGERAIIVKIKSENFDFRRRLIEMGITFGVQIEVKKFAPLGDPVGISVRGYELVLRKSELRNIEARVCI